MIKKIFILYLFISIISCSYAPYNKDSIIASRYLSEMTKVAFQENKSSSHDIAPADYLLFYEKGATGVLPNYLSIYQIFDHDILEKNRFNIVSKAFDNNTRSDFKFPSFENLNLSFDFLYHRSLIIFPISHLNSDFYTNIMDGEEKIHQIYGFLVPNSDQQYRFLVPNPQNTNQVITKNIKCPALFYLKAIEKNIRNAPIGGEAATYYNQVSMVSQPEQPRPLITSATGGPFVSMLENFFKMPIETAKQAKVDGATLGDRPIKVVLFVNDSDMDYFSILDGDGLYNDKVVVARFNSLEFFGGDLTNNNLIADSKYSFMFYASFVIRSYAGTTPNGSMTTDLFDNQALFEAEVMLDTEHPGNFKADSFKITNMISIQNPQLAIDTTMPFNLNNNIIDSVGEIPYYNHLGDTTILSWKNFKSGKNRTLKIVDKNPSKIEFNSSNDTFYNSITKYDDNPNFIVLDILDDKTYLSRKLDNGGNNTYYFTDSNLDYSTATPVSMGPLKYLKATKNESGVWVIYYKYLYLLRNGNSSNELYSIYKIELPKLLKIAKGKSSS